MTDRQIEMHWYCSACHHDNRGRDITCANCGKPRENEEYLMPSDTRAAPSVTDPKLLRQATAGPNWSCHYCRSSQRRLDGACARCGAPAAEGVTEGEGAESRPDESPTSPPVSADVEAEPVAIRGAASFRAHRKLLLSLAGVLFATLLVWWLFVPHPQHVTVSAVSWTHSVEIERYRVTTESGWWAASDAFDVRNEGARIHHYDHRAVGSHLEHYTVQVACGQTCTSIPKSCYETCSSNKNGYATCRTSCSGGGQSCSTKYCSEGRTRSVTDYRDFPIYQDWYSWHAWRWLHQRDIVLSGKTTETRWPSAAELRLREGIADREDEREGSKRSAYSVVYREGRERWETSPKSEAEFRRRALRSRWRIETNRLGMVSDEQPE